VIKILTREDKRGKIVSLVDVACGRENSFSCGYSIPASQVMGTLRESYDISIPLLKKSSST
jgi:hypothetical protein